MHRNSAGLEATMKSRRGFFGPNVLSVCEKQTLYFWLFMVPTERMEGAVCVGLNGY